MSLAGLGDWMELKKDGRNEYVCRPSRTVSVACSYCGRQYGNRPDRSCDGCGATEFREVSVA